MLRTRTYLHDAVAVETTITFSACTDGSSGMRGMDRGSSSEMAKAPTLLAQANVTTQIEEIQTI